MILSIIDSLNDFVKPFKNWITSNHNNPLLWLGLFLLGLAIFAITYSVLNRNNE